MIDAVNVKEVGLGIIAVQFTGVGVVHFPSDFIPLCGDVGFFRIVSGDLDPIDSDAIHGGPSA